MIEYIETITSDVEAEICFQNHQFRLKEIIINVETIQDIIDYYSEKLKVLQENVQKELDNFKFKALVYFDAGVDESKKKETKTMIKYKLPSFEIIETKEKIEADRVYFDKHIADYPEYIKQTETLKWGELKKGIIVNDRQVYLDGELIEDAPIKIKEAERKIKY